MYNVVQERAQVKKEAMRSLLVAVLVWSLVSLVGSMGTEEIQEVKINYDEALEKAILFFEGQRSGKLPSDQRVKWRGDSALSDGHQENVDLVGGYYDAGDNVKFLWPMSFTGTLLSWAATEYHQQISSAGQIHHLRSAIRWVTDFVLKSYTSSTTLYTQVGDGESDHKCWERPEDMDTPRTLYKISSSSPGSEVAADASAALSSASIVFRSIDLNYTSKLLTTSKSLFELANEHQGSYKGSCPFYCSYSGYNDELLWAAGWLYKATKASKYLDFVLNNQGWSQEVSEFSWDNKLAGVQALLTKEYLGGKKELSKYKNDLDRYVCSLLPDTESTKVQRTPGGLLYTRESANNQYVTGASFLLLFYSTALQSTHTAGIQCGSSHISSTQITSFAKSQVDYILGKNPLGMSYMVGHGNKYPFQLHHRGASIPYDENRQSKVDCKAGFSTWFSTCNPNPNTHVGAVVGGPDRNDQFHDNRSDPSHLEPTTYMNAALVAALAALQSEQGHFVLPLTTNSTSSISAM